MTLEERYMFTFAKMKNEHVTELSNTLFTRVLPEEGSLSWSQNFATKCGQCLCTCSDIYFTLKTLFKHTLLIT